MTDLGLSAACCRLAHGTCPTCACICHLDPGEHEYARATAGVDIILEEDRT